MIKMCLTVSVLMVNMGCASGLNDTFKSEVLTSSKGEKIYVNTLNWGVTDDHQITAISADKDKARERSDTVDVVKGLDPFVYAFKNDTLSLYFNGNINYKIKNEFKTIYIKYVSLGKRAYREVRAMAYDNESGYCSVPKYRRPNYPPDMPKPISK